MQGGECFGVRRQPPRESPCVGPPPGGYWKLLVSRHRGLTTMAKSAQVGRPYITAPTVGATNGASWKLQIPIWISSVVAHGGLLAAFWAVLTIFGLTQHLQSKAVA